MILLTKDQAFANDKVYKGKSKSEIFNEKILSLEYKKTGFKLSLIGSDEVVQACNGLMQYIYHLVPGQVSIELSLRLMKLLGDLLLEIRKSVGNENTKLDNLGMLEWFISDIEKYRNLK